MKLAKRVLPLLLCLLLLVPQTAFAAAPTPSTASRSVQTVYLYGQPVTLYTYLLNGENYVRLHDLAWYCSAGSSAFSARWSGADSAVYLTTGGIYISGGTENLVHTPGAIPSSLIQPDPYTLYVDGEPVSVRSYTINGYGYYNLRELCAALGMSVEWDASLRTIVLREQQSSGAKTILVDAGHGGSDPGAISSWLGNESGINLDVATRLAELLRSAGFNVGETRTGDQTVTLAERQELIKSLQPDLVVSVHHNASESRTGSGATVLAQIADQYGGPSRQLAELLNSEYASLGRPINSIVFRRGWRGDYYAILRAAAEAGVPAVISEYAFIDNASDWRAVGTAQARSAEAQAIYRAVCDWFALQSR